MAPLFDSGEEWNGPGHAMRPGHGVTNTLRSMILLDAVGRLLIRVDKPASFLSGADAGLDVFHGVSRIATGFTVRLRLFRLLILLIARLAGHAGLL